MTLRPEIVPAPHRLLTNMIATAIGLGVVGGVVAIAASTTPVPPASVPPPPAVIASEPVAMHASAVAPAPAPPEPASEFLFVFRAGGSTFVKLADVAQDEDGTKHLPKHGKLKLAETDGIVSAVGAIADADVPGGYAAMLGKELRVDGKCTARVADFAVVSRLTGDTAYAGVQGTSWTAKSVAEHGTAVIAARITGCKTGMFARDAALPPAIVFEQIKNADLVLAARSALLASDANAKAQAHWKETDGQGEWSEAAEFDTRVLRHPRTGAIWVAVHANQWAGCGGPEANVWGLFRVNADGALETVDARLLDTVTKIEQVVDIDGDGDLDVIGRPWLGIGMTLIDGDGTVLDTMEIPFYGCPC
jgi:hypothetical protein